MPEHFADVQVAFPALLRTTGVLKMMQCGEKCRGRRFVGTGDSAERRKRRSETQF